jgi:hypothetical protein
MSNQQLQLFPEEPTEIQRLRDWLLYNGDEIYRLQAIIEKVRSKPPG